jgi:hypothetical protein
MTLRTFQEPHLRLRIDRRVGNFVWNVAKMLLVLSLRGNDKAMTQECKDADMYVWKASSVVVFTMMAMSS